jgi:hypothetical protein
MCGCKRRPLLDNALTIVKRGADKEDRRPREDCLAYRDENQRIK